MTLSYPHETATAEEDATVLPHPDLPSGRAISLTRRSVSLETWSSQPTPRAVLVSSIFNPPQVVFTQTYPLDAFPAAINDFGVLAYGVPAGVNVNNSLLIAYNDTFGTNVINGFGFPVSLNDRDQVAIPLYRNTGKHRRRCRRPNPGSSEASLILSLWRPRPFP
jgi:hypothetical protein